MVEAMAEHDSKTQLSATEKHNTEGLHTEILNNLAYSYLLYASIEYTFYREHLI